MSTTSDVPFGTGDASFQAAGGESGLARLVEDFYLIMDELEDARCVRHLYPRDLAESRKRLAGRPTSLRGTLRQHQHSAVSHSLDSGQNRARCLA